MCCRESTAEEEDDVSFPIRNTIDDDQAVQLLDIQRQLKEDRLRGDAREVAEWIHCGYLKAEVAVNADAVGILVFEEDLTKDDAGLLEFRTEAYAGKKSLDGRDFLCDEITFGGSRGSCCLIGTNRVLTAGHILDGSARKHLADRTLCVVFGFRTHADGIATTAFEPASQIAWLVPPAGFSPDPEFQEEWLTLEFDPQMSDLSCRSHATISEESLVDCAAVYTLGHPNGLSLRYSLSPSTVPGPEGMCFRAFVDGYDGASGSPVFDACSHKLVGIVVATGQLLGAVRIKHKRHLSQVCTPQTSAGTSCLLRPVAIKNRQAAC